MEYIVSVLKALGMFIVGLTAFRLMGSQAVGRLTDFDLVVVIAIGALIGAPLADPDLKLSIPIVAILGLVIAQMITSWLTIKSPFFEQIIVGKPIKLIKHGKVLLNGLRKARITKNDLTQELRVKGLHSMVDIERAYMEPNGKLSVIQKTKDNE